MYSRSREIFCEKEIVKIFFKKCKLPIYESAITLYNGASEKISEEKDEGTREYTAESFVRGNKGFVFPFFRNFLYRK